MGRRLVFGFILALLLAPAGTHVFAVPTCPTPGATRALCGGRIIPEAMQSTGFLTYNEWIAAMTQLQTEHPDRVKFDNIGLTAGGRPLYDVMVTDFSDPTPLSQRIGLFFNGDIHGDERDGTEGFARVIEDLAETTDGTLSNDLKQLVLVFTDINPDGWQIGDYDSPPGNTNTFTRENAAVHDLNREWPVVGFQNPTTNPFVDPEVQNGVQAHGNVLHRLQGINFAYGYDVHGSAGAETPPTAQLMLDVLLSAGEFDLKRSMLQTQLFSQYMSNLSATTSDNILAEIGSSTGNLIYRVGDWDTSWDIYGYLVSGGYADWQANQWTGLGAVTGTIELWLNGEPGQENTFGGFNQTIEASNVHSMRLSVRTAMDLALQPQHATLALPGPIAWVSNSFALQATDGTPGAGTPIIGPKAPPGRPYPATTNQFFQDLVGYADHPVTQLDASTITSASQLSGYSDVVVAQDAHLTDPLFLTALHDYANNGGIVILTDGALRDLSAITTVPSSAVGTGLVYAGYVDVVSGDPLAQGLHAAISRQTYEPVPVGYPIDNTFSSSSSSVHSPAWWVTQSVWEANGGRTAGTTGTSQTSLGEIPVGAGKVRILGSLLPDPSGDARHPFGVSDYGVTYVGYKLFENLLSASATLTPPIVENGPFTTNPTPGPAPSVPESPLTPLLVMVAVPVALVGLRAARRRRSAQPA